MNKFSQINILFSSLTIHPKLSFKFPKLIHRARPSITAMDSRTYLANYSNIFVQSGVSYHILSSIYLEMWGLIKSQDLASIYC